MKFRLLAINKMLSGLPIIASLIVLFIFFSMTITPAFAVEPDYTIFKNFGAYKFASHKELGPHQTMSYTILLYNSSTELITVDVVDRLPSLLKFVEGSADDSGGVYEPYDNTLNWNDVEVSPISQVMLTFDVVQASAISEPIEVINTAVITSDLEIIETEAVTLLTPDNPMDDVEYPVVKSIIIDEADALTEREVILHIDATDNVDVESMYIKEYRLVDKPNFTKQWEATKSEGWVPFQDEYPWMLGENPGVHFVGVWVADAAGNISFATQESFDFASYLEPETTIENKITNIPYAVYYEEGVQVTAILDQMSGPDGLCLYIWYAGNYGNSDKVSCTDAEEVQFTTQSTGIYLFVVGVSAPEQVSYNLSISPGGGSSAWIGGNSSSVALIGIENSVSLNSSLFAEAGLDPISMAIADQPTGAPVIPNYPSSIHRFHLPIVCR